MTETDLHVREIMKLLERLNRRINNNFMPNLKLDAMMKELDRLVKKVPNEKKEL